MAAAVIAPLALAGLFTATANAQERVVIATYGGEFAESWRKAVAEPFQEETGIPTEIFESPLPSGAVQSAEGNPTFHLAIIGGYSAYRLAAGGMVEELVPEDVPNLKDIPEEYWIRSPSGKLVGVPINFEYLGIAYNTDLATAEDFSSWRNLLDPKWKDQVSMSRPAFVAAYDLTLFAILNGGDAKNIEPGLPMIEQLSNNVLSVYTSMASLEAQLGRGEVVAAPFYSGNIVLLKQAGVTNIDMVRPKEGGLLLPYLLVIPKGATNLEATKKLLNAILSPEYQLRLMTTGAWPINPKTTLSPEQEQLLGGTLEDAMANNYAPDWGVVSENLSERTRMIEEIIGKVE